MTKGTTKGTTKTTTVKTVKESVRKPATKVPTKKGVNKDKMTKEILPELKWRTKQVHRCANSSKNVSISLTKAGSKQKADTKILNIIIRDNLFKQLNSDYAMFAVLKNRLYFKGTTAGMGYKIGVKNTSGYIQATLQPNEIAEFEPFIGHFTWRYDEYYELYYIDIEREACDDYTFANS